MYVDRFRRTFRELCHDGCELRCRDFAGVVSVNDLEHAANLVEVLLHEQAFLDEDLFHRFLSELIN